MGRRFGGPKQLEPVGPTGACLLEYTIHDALDAGFGTIVLIVREETREDFESRLGAAIRRRAPLHFALQETGDLPEGVRIPPRTKPWGTAHAVLCAQPVVRAPFVAVNGDDYYGKEAFPALRDHLSSQEGAIPPAFAMVGYRLRESLPEKGSVSRAVCTIDGDGWLVSISEIEGLERTGDGGRYRDASGDEITVAGDALVSMNIWGFTPAVFDLLADAFTRFLREPANLEKSELYLPRVIQEAMLSGAARVKVLPSRNRWFGITNPADKEIVQRRLLELTEGGAYPRELWR
jgi:NDP-sugar pyrophosphorylase family protein